jgi:hypothetical protein
MMGHKVGEFNLKQIDYMKHAIGYESSRVKRRVYKAYRNYFTTRVDCGDYSDWEKLVELGLATNRKLENGQGIVYFVSKEGFTFLGDLLGIKITEMD